VLPEFDPGRSAQQLRALATEKPLQPPQLDGLERAHVAFADHEGAARGQDARELSDGVRHGRYVHQHAPADDPAKCPVGELQPRQVALAKLRAVPKTLRLDRGARMGEDRRREIQPEDPVAATCKLDRLDRRPAAGIQHRIRAGRAEASGDVVESHAVEAVVLRGTKLARPDVVHLHRLERGLGLAACIGINCHRNSCTG